MGYRWAFVFRWKAWVFVPSVVALDWKPLQGLCLEILLSLWLAHRCFWNAMNCLFCFTGIRKWVKKNTIVQLGSQTSCLVLENLQNSETNKHHVKLRICFLFPFWPMQWAATIMGTKTQCCVWDSRNKWLMMILSRLVLTVGTADAKIVVSASFLVEGLLVEWFH